MNAAPIMDAADLLDDLVRPEHRAALAWAAAADPALGATIVDFCRVLDLAAWSLELRPDPRRRACFRAGLRYWVGAVGLLTDAYADEVRG